MPLGLMLLMLVLLLPLLALRHSSIIAVIPVDGCQKKKEADAGSELGQFSLRTKPYPVGQMGVSAGWGFFHVALVKSVKQHSAIKSLRCTASAPHGIFEVAPILPPTASTIIFYHLIRMTSH